MNVLDLFSGIGGFSLGLERAGMRTVQFVEQDPYCRAVLRKHWPDVPCHDDVRTFPGVPCDVICGGFPCQDISIAGAGAGLSGERSGLWAHYHRLIRHLRPRFAIVENVSALLHRGLDTVLGDLASIGYDAEWHCIPAATVGAPHRRDRIWIVAYPCDAEWRQEREARGTGRPQLLREGEEGSAGSGDRREALADSDSSRKPQPQGPLIPIWRWLGNGSPICDANGAGLQVSGQEPDGEDWQQSRRMPAAADWWAIEPNVGRMAHGVPSRVDRIGTLGNAVVPQIPEIIGRAIMKSFRLNQGINAK